MKCAVVVHNDPASAYGVTVRDLPGCFLPVIPLMRRWIIRLKP